MSAAVCVHSAQQYVGMTPSCMACAPSRLHRNEVALVVGGAKCDLLFSHVSGDTNYSNFTGMQQVRLNRPVRCVAALAPGAAACSFIIGAGGSWILAGEDNRSFSPVEGRPRYAVFGECKLSSYSSGETGDGGMAQTPLSACALSTASSVLCSTAEGGLHTLALDSSSGDVRVSSQVHKIRGLGGLPVDNLSPLDGSLDVCIGTCMNSVLIFDARSPGLLVKGLKWATEDVLLHASGCGGMVIGSSEGGAVIRWDLRLAEGVPDEDTHVASTHVSCGDGCPQTRLLIGQSGVPQSSFLSTGYDGTLSYWEGQSTEFGFHRRIVAPVTMPASNTVTEEGLAPSMRHSPCVGLCQEGVVCCTADQSGVVRCYRIE